MIIIVWSLKWFIEIIEIVTSSTKLHCISCLKNRTWDSLGEKVAVALVGCLIQAVLHGAALAELSQIFLLSVNNLSMKPKWPLLFIRNMPKRSSVIQSRILKFKN